MLKTANIFVDTEQWRSIRLDWSHELAAAIRQGCVERRLSLKTTLVLNMELENHIARCVDSYVDSLVATNSRCAVSLKNCSNVLSGYDASAAKLKMKHQLVANMRSYFQDCAAQDLPMNPNAAYQILGDYFKELPPFDIGTKKKHEFPDAFALHALHEWARNRQENIYVVSQDKGVRAYCETSGWLVHVETLSDLVRQMNEDVPDQIAVARELSNYSYEVTGAIADVIGRMPASAMRADHVSVVDPDVLVSAYRLVLNPAPNQFVVYADVEANFVAELKGDGPGPSAGTAYQRSIESAVHAVLKGRFKLVVTVADAFRIEAVEPLDGDSIVVEADLWVDPSGVKVRAHISDDSFPF